MAVALQSARLVRSGFEKLAKSVFLSGDHDPSCAVMG
jgi:hypothetical protein